MLALKLLSKWVLVSSVSLTLLTGCTSKTKTEPPNTIHVAQTSEIKGLDPLYTSDLASGTEASRVYEGLLQFHYLKRPYTLIPNLAESMPDVSADGKTLTFKIKKGVLFQDNPCFKATQGKGRELVADDFVYTFKRIADPKLAGGGFWLFEGKIAGIDAWHGEAAKAPTTDYTKEIEGIKAIDRYTLQIKLVQRSAQFLFSLAMPLTFVVPHEGVEHYGKEFINHAVGTGPFRLESFSGASRIVWVKNPTYRLETYPSEGEHGDKEKGLLDDAGKPLPLADRVVVQIFKESQPKWLTFLSGKLDLADIPKDNFAQAIAPSGKELTPELKAKGIRLMIDPELDITHFSFNMKDPLVGKNKYLRQALSVAYDEGPFIEKFYNGRAVAAQGPIPPGLSGYDPNYKNPYRQFDLNKAKELLAKAGYPEGKGLPPLEYATLTDSTTRQGTEYAEMAFGKIGVKLKVNGYSWPEFQSAVKNHKGQLWSFAWLADYPDAENFLQLFYSKNASPGPNDSSYSNPEFDRLYEKSLTLVEGPERTALYKKMSIIVVEDCPWIFGAHRLGYSLAYSWLKNVKPHDFDHARIKYYRIDPSLKK